MNLKYLYAFSPLLGGAAASCVYLGVQAWATVYGWPKNNVRTFHISQATRPTTPRPIGGHMVFGSCKEDGATPITCPHNHEEIRDVQCVAKTSGGVTMTGWGPESGRSWVTAGQTWNSTTAQNDYYIAFAVGPPPQWPVVLPTGCNGGACPQWPSYCQFNLAGDNPPGPENWTGHSVVQEVNIGSLAWPNW